MNKFLTWLEQVKEQSPELKIPLHIEQSIEVPIFNGVVVPTEEMYFYSSKTVLLSSSSKPISKFIIPFEYDSE